MSDVTSAVTSSPVLEVQNLSKTYHQGGNSLRVLADVCFQVAVAERVAIVGVSGTGKSTLLHLLGGLDRPDTGSILIEGRDLLKMSESALCQLRNERLGFVYQFHHLLKEFNACENVAMPLLIRGQSRGAAMKKAADLLDRVGLSERLDHKPAQLSGGERQRCAIARALVGEPACVLADEPTGNLDEVSAAQVDDLMLSLSEEMNTSFVVVTHNPDLAERMNRTLRLHNGKLE